MPRLRYLRSAREDLVSIFAYIARESGSQVIGRHFVGILRQQCRQLAALPGVPGTARPELRPDIRSFPCRGYVIFFRYRDGVLAIVNILEGHRDVAVHMRRADD